MTTRLNFVCGTCPIVVAALAFLIGWAAYDYAWPTTSTTERPDKNVIVELSTDVVYKGEEVTLTFSYADGRPVDEVMLYLPGETRRVGGNSITVRWEDFVDPKTGVVNKTSTQLSARVKVGGKYRPTVFPFELANVERPPDTPEESTEPSPAVSIISVWPEGDQGTLTYRCVAEASLDGCTLNGYTWYFGSDPTPHFTNSEWIDHTFPGTGDFTIRVVANFTAPDGSPLSDMDEGLYTIGENQPPTAKLYIKSVSEGGEWAGDWARGPVPLTVLFTGEVSRDPEGEPLVAYYWYFGTANDPVVTTVPTVSYEFKDPGTHTVQLVVEDAWGNQSAMSNKATVEVTFGESELLHYHDATGPDPDTINFTVKSPYEKDAVSMSFAWDFGDGTDRLLTDTANVAHTYQRLGKYTVQVECRYYYADGQSATITMQKTFAASGPVKAHLSASPLNSVAGAPVLPLDQLPTGTQLMFNGAKSHTPYGKFVKYEFDLDGDGVYEHELDKPSISFKAGAPGMYTAYLRVTDEHGNQDIAALSYTVLAKLTAALTVTPPSGPPPLTVRCDASASSNPNGALDYFIWQISDEAGAATSDTSPSDVIEVTFEGPGKYLIEVIACDQLGSESAPAEQWVTVGDVPSAVITYSSPVYAGNAMTFHGDSSSSPNGAIVMYEWDLHGQGFAADQGAVLVDEGPTATATYNELGQRTVRLRVTDELGISATTSVTFEVVAVPPSTGGLPFGTKAPIR